MKIVFIIIFTVVQLQLSANMAEPVDRGSIFSRPFTGQFVTVDHEDLSIKIDESFQYAYFEIVYHINASKDGVNIPLLFYASELSSDFKIEFDEKSIDLKEVPDEYYQLEDTKFKDFAYFFSSENADKSRSSILIDDSPSGGFYVSLNDLKYFETDILKGTHKIRITYTATNWKDSWDWVNEYSFRYALSPAKYWKSFGTLSITLDAEDFDESIETNLGEPTSGDINTTAKWDFDQLPTEILKIIYNPKISGTAETLIQTGPKRLAYLLGLLLVLIHIFSIRLYRLKNPAPKFSIVVLLGSIVVPLLFFVFWAYSFTLIDNIIGEDASRQHGYSELVVIFYPLVLPIYWLVMWLVDRFYKKIANKKTISDGL